MAKKKSRLESMMTKLKDITNDDGVVEETKKKASKIATTKPKSKSKQTTKKQTKAPTKSPKQTKKKTTTTKAKPKKVSKKKAVKKAVKKADTKTTKSKVAKATTKTKKTRKPRKKRVTKADIRKEARAKAVAKKEAEPVLSEAETEFLESRGQKRIWIDKKKGHYHIDPGVTKTMAKEIAEASMSTERKELIKYNKKNKTEHRNWFELTREGAPFSIQFINKNANHLIWHILLAKQDLTDQTDAFIKRHKNAFVMLLIGVVQPEYDFDIESFSERYNDLVTSKMKLSNRRKSKPKKKLKK